MEEIHHLLSLPFPRPLHQAIFLKRPNRFVVECQLVANDEVVLAHLPDPGRLKELLLPGKEIWLMENDHPNRKTKWTACICEREDGKGYVSIHTAIPNQLIENGLKNRLLEEFAPYTLKKAEYTFGKSRWDFLLEKDTGRKLLLEVKSVTLVEGNKGWFPDAVTARGTKHVKELTSIAKSKEFDTAILFVVQRNDVKYVTPAEHIDKKFSEALKEAKACGVKLFARICHVNEKEIKLGSSIPVKV